MPLYYHHSYENSFTNLTENITATTTCDCDCQRIQSSQNNVLCLRRKGIGSIGYSRSKACFDFAVLATNHLTHIERFLSSGLSFCNVSGISRHNILFRNPTYYSEIPLWDLKIFVVGKKLFHVVLVYIGHHIRFLRIWYLELGGDLHTLKLSSSWIDLT